MINAKRLQFVVYGIILGYELRQMVSRIRSNSGPLTINIGIKGAKKPIEPPEPPEFHCSPGKVMEMTDQPR